MNANHRYIQLLCRFKIAMRRQLIAVDLDTFISFAVKPRPSGRGCKAAIPKGLYQSIK